MASSKKKKDQKRNTGRYNFQHWQRISFYLAIYDGVAIIISYFLGLWLRFDLRMTMIPREYLNAFIRFIPIYVIASIIIFSCFHLYNSLWRYASFSELNHIAAATVVTALIHILGITIFFARMPISYYVIGILFQFIAVTGVRFAYRYINLQRSRLEKAKSVKHNVMVIGAGSAGRVLIREIKNSDKLQSKVCCVIDDNPNKKGRYIEGIKIVGNRNHIFKAVKEYKIDQIFMAIPSASAKQKRNILNICKETGCEMKTLPGIYQFANGDVSISKMKPVAIEDLLGRDQIKVDMTEIFKQISGKTILVTGGGGSIGSELCRQIAAHQPKQLIIFDVYENNAYDIEQELKRKYGDTLNLVALIGSVRDSRRLDSVFKQYRPQLVFHAAAHKHVPLMETSPNESIKNNVIGTYKTAYYAMKYGTDRFVLISTDKAVNPTNIMGASKRLCEMVIQGMDAVSREGRRDLLPQMHAHGRDSFNGSIGKDPIDHTTVELPTGEINKNRIRTGSVNNKLRKKGTQFVAVRFGNVLGSNGSVIPLFKRQIAEGGPVTVTHPDIVRYFMTIPEAVSLVLEAATYAWGGEIFVLDMGEAVKIDTLARNLIKLSGYEPDVDIKIEYSGLRPGEKLFEEKLMAEEGMKNTDNKLIHIGKPLEFDVEIFFNELGKLAEASYENDPDIVQKVERIVPTFHPVGAHPEEKRAKASVTA